MLRKTSKFFDAALKQEWEEGKKRTVCLPDDNPDLVYAYVQWVYAGKVFAKTKDDDDEPTFTPLAKQHALGEKLLDDNFQDCVLNEMISLTRENEGYLPVDADITIIYESTGTSSPARRLLVDMFTWGGGTDPIGWVREDGIDVWPVPQEFKDDLIKSMFKNCYVMEKHKEDYKALDGGVPCTYHNHGKDRPCVAKSVWVAVPDDG